MGVFIALLTAIAMLAAFAAGTKYGHECEAQAIAYKLRAESYVKAEYRTVLADIKNDESAFLDRIKMFL